MQIILQPASDSASYTRDCCACDFLYCREVYNIQIYVMIEIPIRLALYCMMNNWL